MHSRPKIIFPEVAVNLYKPANPVEVPIVDNQIATLEASPNKIRHITFDVSGTALEGHIRAGQSIGILPYGLKERDGSPAKVRLYSVASPSRGEDGEGKLIATTIKRVIDEEHDTQKLFLGLCSNYLSDFNPGETVKMTGPSGKRFVLPENADDFNYLLFATGTGVAPYRGMLADLLERPGFRNQVTLVFGAPYSTDLLYYDYFREMSVRHDNFHYLTSVSREGLRPDGRKNYVQHHLMDSQEILEPILSRENTLIYICGLKGMEIGLFSMLVRQGHAGYLKISEELNVKPPEQWDTGDLKKRVRPGDRLFVEVY